MFVKCFPHYIFRSVLYCLFRYLHPCVIIKAMDSMQRFLGKLKEILRAKVRDSDLSEDDFNFAVKQAAGHAGGMARWEALLAAKAESDGGKEFIYSKLEDLPDPVRKSLPTDAAKIWMAVFNATIKDNKNDAISAATAWAAVKRAGWRKNEEGK